MLIHSVTSPLMLTEQQPYPEAKFKPFEGGYLEGFDTPQGFMLSRLNSTDPSLYLDSAYTPGGIYTASK